MKTWFANLDAREQLMVSVGAVVVALIIFWAFVWLPLDRGRADLSTNVATWQQSLGELRVLAATADADGGAAVDGAVIGDPNASPVVVVDQTLRDRNLNAAVKRRQPTPNGIRVEFENVAFDELVLWLGDLHATHGLSVQQGSLSQAGRAEPGRINASLTLERAP